MPLNCSAAQRSAGAQSILVMAEPPVQTQPCSLFARTVSNNIGDRHPLAPKLVYKGQGWKPVLHLFLRWVLSFGKLVMAKQSLLKEFLITVLLLVGALIVFAGSSPLAPFIYPLF
jgi:hypothetical protein